MLLIKAWTEKPQINKDIVQIIKSNISDILDENELKIAVDHYLGGYKAKTLDSNIQEKSVLSINDDQVIILFTKEEQDVEVYQLEAKKSKKPRKKAEPVPKDVFPFKSDLQQSETRSQEWCVLFDDKMTTDDASKILEQFQSYITEVKMFRDSDMAKAAVILLPSSLEGYNVIKGLQKVDSVLSIESNKNGNERML